MVNSLENSIEITSRLTVCHGQAIILNVSNIDVVQELKIARADFLDSLDGLTPDQMLIPGVAGYWSIKDIIAHLTAWQSELVTGLNHIQNKRVPNIVKIEDMQSWNEEQYHINVRRPFSDVFQDFEGVHRMLVKMVGDFNSKILFDNRRFSWMEGEPLYYLIEDAAIYHEKEHAEDIRRWREENGY